MWLRSQLRGWVALSTGRRLRPPPWPSAPAASNPTCCHQEDARGPAPGTVTVKATPRPPAACHGAGRDPGGGALAQLGAFDALHRPAER